MEYITNWVKNIIIIVLITTFLGMFLPESNLRKYVRVVMGFFIISIFISPISLLINGELKINNSIIPENIMESKWKEIEEKGRDTAARNEQIIDNHYLQNINQRIKEIIAVDFPEYEIKVYTEIKNKYSIERININIYDNKEIRPVKITEIGEDNQNREKEIQAEIKAKIVDCKISISNFLHINPAVLNIKYFSGGDMIACF